jgi:hypothetical protein
MSTSTDISGEWVHSHEEDEGDRVVLRRPDRPFPPARGRVRLTLQPGGEIEGAQPGPDDRPVSAAGTWTPDTLSTDALGGELAVESASDDTLVLRRRT